MRKTVFGVLYMALALVANPLLADSGELEAMRKGTMKKLFFAEQPAPVSDVAFTDRDGNVLTLADWRGKFVLVNFWATWCAPCLAEMPALDALQAEFGGERFEVVTIATGRNALAAIDRFFAKGEIANLPVLLDPGQDLSRDMGVLGLPASFLVDPEGREIGRMRGDAAWYSDSARAIIAAWIGAGAPQG